MTWQDDADKLFNEMDKREREEKAKAVEEAKQREEATQKLSQYYDNTVRPAFDQLEKKFSERYKVETKGPSPGSSGYTINISFSPGRSIYMHFFIDNEKPTLEIHRGVATPRFDNFNTVSHYSQVTEEHICKSILKEIAEFIKETYPDK